MRLHMVCAVSLLGLLGCSSDLKVNGVEPAQGAYMGGEEVVIRGNGFQTGRGVIVTFGKNPASSVVIESSDRIKVQTPAGNRNSSVDVLVTFDDGKAFQIKNAFRYLDPSQEKAAMEKSLDNVGGRPKK